MPETPVHTATGVHPFDDFELAAIRGACAGGLVTDDYARHVMPAMAEKIEQLRTLYEQAVDVRSSRRRPEGAPMIPVRHNALPSVLHTFPQPGPALHGSYCPACDEPYAGTIALVPIGPGPALKDQDKARGGRWHTAAAVAVHAACAGLAGEVGPQ